MTVVSRIGDSLAPRSPIRSSNGSLVYLVVAVAAHNRHVGDQQRLKKTKSVVDEMTTFWAGFRSGPFLFEDD